MKYTNKIKPKQIPIDWKTDLDKWWNLYPY
jgi:hypothetical protein